MSKSASLKDDDDRNCTDEQQTIQNLQKVARSDIRNELRNEKIRKSAASSSFTLSDDEGSNYSQSDQDLHDDDDFVPTGSDDDEFRTKKVIPKPVKKRSRVTNKKSNFVAISDSVLNLSECIEEMKGLPNPLFEIVPNLDITQVDTDSNIFNAEMFQKNTSAIHILNQINSAKQTNRGPGGKGAPVDVLAPHYAELEAALQNMDPLFHAPQNHPSCSSSTQELTKSSLAETLVGLKDKSIEKNGPEMIDKIPHIPVRLREHEEKFLREPFPHERECISGERCEGLFIGSSSKIDGFVLVEFPSQSALDYFNVHKNWPKQDPERCILCERKAISDRYYEFLSGNFFRTNENPMRFIEEIAYSNKVGPGEYAYSDCFTTSQNALDGAPVPIVHHHRCIYQQETRMVDLSMYRVNPTEPIEECDRVLRRIRYYRQNLTNPASFLDGRTEQQFTSSTSTQH